MRGRSMKLPASSCSPILSRCMFQTKSRRISDLDCHRSPRMRATALLGAALTVALATSASMAAAYERVVILGFDGADAGLVEEYMAAGRLPNLARLRAEGIYSPLRSTNPPQTPVSWAAFATGLNPGRTEIFDFLRRTEGTYLPDFAMIKETRRPLLFGECNAVVLGALTAGLAAAVTAVVLWLRRRRWMIVAA